MLKIGLTIMVTSYLVALSADSRQNSFTNEFMIPIALLEISTHLLKIRHYRGYQYFPSETCMITIIYSRGVIKNLIRATAILISVYRFELIKGS